MSRVGGPGDLAQVLGALPVRIAGIAVQRAAVPLADYPGGPRPSSTVVISGGGQTGRGENVAFTEAEHQDFAARAGALLARAVGSSAESPGATGAASGSGSVSVSSFDQARPRSVQALVDVLGQDARPAERAALEAALIDLGLRQAGSSLRDLTGVATGRLRAVVSFAASPDPRARVRALRATGYLGQLKIDVDPGWNAEICRDLARETGIAILDFKGRGDLALGGLLATLFPVAIFEDPPAGILHRHISRDAPLLDCQGVAQALARGEAVNLKAPRMGGPLAVLRALELAGAVTANTNANANAAERADPTGRGPPVVAYLGGMFEVGVGRVQARQLAALFCGESPNDLAPHAGQQFYGPWLSVDLDRPGFGSHPDRAE